MVFQTRRSDFFSGVECNFLSKIWRENGATLVPLLGSKLFAPNQEERCIWEFLWPWT